MYQTIRYEVSEGIATIRFDRAEKLNAYTPEMGDETVAAFEQARDDDAVRLVILTGVERLTGDTIEVGGADLKHALGDVEEGTVQRHIFVVRPACAEANVAAWDLLGKEEKAFATMVG